MKPGDPVTLPELFGPAYGRLPGVVAEALGDTGRVLVRFEHPLYPTEDWAAEVEERELEVDRRTASERVAAMDAALAKTVGARETREAEAEAARAEAERQAEEKRKELRPEGALTAEPDGPVRGGGRG